MKKQKINNLLVNIVGMVISFVLGWYVLDSLLLAIALAVLVFLLITYVLKRKAKLNMKLKHIDDAYNFVNLMNVHMLSTNSVYEAYKSAENYLSVDFCGIDSDEYHSHLNEISNSYDINAFKMYVNTLIIYDNDGGNYKEMEKIPTSLCQKTKIYHHQLISNKKNKLYEISTLYVLWLIVICFLRATIADYYVSMMKDVVYQLSIFSILACGFICYFMAYIDCLNAKIKGL